MPDVRAGENPAVRQNGLMARRASSWERIILLVLRFVSVFGVDLGSLSMVKWIVVVVCIICMYEVS